MIELFHRYAGTRHVVHQFQCRKVNLIQHRIERFRSVLFINDNLRHEALTKLFSQRTLNTVSHLSGHIAPVIQLKFLQKLRNVHTRESSLEQFFVTTGNGFHDRVCVLVGKEPVNLICELIHEVVAKDLTTDTFKERPRIDIFKIKTFGKEIGDKLSESGINVCVFFRSNNTIFAKDFIRNRFSENLAFEIIHCCSKRSDNIINLRICILRHVFNGRLRTIEVLLPDILCDLPDSILDLHVLIGCHQQVSCLIVYFLRKLPYRTTIHYPGQRLRKTNNSILDVGSTKFSRIPTNYVRSKFSCNISFLIVQFIKQGRSRYPLLFFDVFINLTIQFSNCILLIAKAIL